MRTTLAVLASASTLACSAQQLPPPAPPPYIVPIPTVALGPPPAGSSEVLIDADHPAAVDEITTVVGHHGGVLHRPVCLTTPCAAHLTQGPHVLELRTLADDAWGGDTPILVGPGRSALRYALGHRDAGMTVAGALLVLLGGLVGVTGIKGAASPDADSSRVGKDVLVGGLVTVLLGAIVLAIAPATEQPGSATQWPLR